MHLKAAVEGSLVEYMEREYQNCASDQRGISCRQRFKDRHANAGQIRGTGFKTG